MTCYHGGKHVQGLRIANAIKSNSPASPTAYCEPFCGMLGVYRHIDFGNIPYYAGDVNESVIMMWRDAQNGWVPNPNHEIEFWNSMKDSSPCGQKAFTGHSLSYGGIWFSAPKIAQQNHTGRNYAMEAKRASKRVTDIATQLSNVQFSHGSYEQFSHLRGSVIYCDPPYAGTKCHYTTSMDHTRFENWCTEMAAHNTVFVTGYECPSGADVIWQRRTPIAQSAHAAIKKTELLCLYR